MTLSQGFLNSFGLLVIGSALSFVAAWYWATRAARVKLVEKHEAERLKMAEDITALQQQLGLVGQTMQPINAVFQAILIKELTHFHTPEMDALMEQIGPPCTLSAAERDRLNFLLEERTRDMGELISDSERDAAVMLPLVMRRVELEAEALQTAPIALQTVIVPDPEVEPVEIDSNG